MGAVPVDKFGRDHWSTLAYVETRIMDYGGRPDLDHMRTDLDLHPGLGGRASTRGASKTHPTRLAGGVLLRGHDDWSCIDDAIEAGFLVWGGTGIHPIFSLTALGTIVCAEIRKHKQQGGSFSNFLLAPEQLNAMRIRALECKKLDETTRRELLSGGVVCDGQ